jgi:hypothetical protein
MGRAISLFATVIVIIWLVVACEVTRFNTFQRYYPELSYIELLLVGDKLRITPEG